MKVDVKEYTFTNGPVPVYKGGRLTLGYSTRSGRFNLMSNEESLSCHIAVYEDERRLIFCNIDVEYEIDGTDCEEAIWAIQEDIKSHWIDTARVEKQACANFIQRHLERIELGNMEARIEKIDRDLASLTAERERLIGLTSY